MLPGPSSDNTKDARRGGARPTLPPIRDLFREELYQSRGAPPAPTDSPSFSLSRLHVSDDERHPPLRGDRPYSGPLMGPGSRTYTSESAPTPSTSTPQMRSMMTTAHFRSPSDPRGAVPSSSQAFPPENFDPRSSRDSSQRSRAVPRRDFYSTPEPSFSYPSGPHTYGHNTGMAPSSISQSSSSRSVSTYDPRGLRHPDAERTSRQYHEPQLAAQNTGADWSSQEAAGTIPSTSKYECTYCGRGFNRPSSLKIHLNSHTGEKPFMCPIEGCGRSFSVLSNMRRHARVHVQQPHVRPDGSSEDGSDGPSPSLTASSDSPRPAANYPSSAPDAATASGSQHGRQSSDASKTSSQTQSKSSSPEESTRTEKRSRRHQA